MGRDLDHCFVVRKYICNNVLHPTWEINYTFKYLNNSYVPVLTFSGSQQDYVVGKSGSPRIYLVYIYMAQI